MIIIEYVNDEAYKELGMAIVAEAVEEYKCEGDPYKRDELISFFNSEWCYTLSEGIDGEYITNIAKKLRREYLREQRKKANIGNDSKGIEDIFKNFNTKSK